MPNYYVNTDPQSTGENEVHENGCKHGPLASKQKSLGWHSSCSLAIAEAKKHYSKVDGCYYCANACHTR
ncbi:MAG: hypothetical protein ACO1N0_04620 [Fluviicola sp.]